VRRARPWLVPALLYAGLIFWLSSQPDPLPFVPSSILDHDKLLHGALYGVLGALLMGATAGFGLAAGRAFALALLLASAYGASDEFHQSFVPGRTADVGDWVADTAGAALGASLAAAGLRRRRARASIAP